MMCRYEIQEDLTQILKKTQFFSLMISSQLNRVNRLTKNINTQSSRSSLSNPPIRNQYSINKELPQKLQKTSAEELY